MQVLMLKRCDHRSGIRTQFRIVLSKIYANRTNSLLPQYGQSARVQKVRQSHPTPGRA
ncbi:hypothetical protein PUN4_570146 [Paraburkholderia unamae]|nr:hypothetical protein PUN4_570146 [Paraburkholderia unamae]